MILKRLRLRNYCQHRDLDMSFDVGVTGIFGANGAGKSNLMNAPYSATTNDFSRNPGNKTEHILDDCPEEEPAFIHVDYDLNGPLSIFCGLRPNRYEVTYNGETYTGAKAALPFLASLGLQQPLLDNNVFIKQKGLTELLLAKPSARVEQFSRLCGTRHAEQIWDELGKRSTRLSARAELDNDPRDGLRQQIAEAKKTVHHLRGRTTTLTEQVTALSADSAAFTEILNQYARRQQIADLTDRLSSSVQRSASERSRIVKQLERQRQEFETLSVAVPEQMTKVAEAKASLAFSYQRSKQKAHRFRITSELEDAVSELAKVGSVEDPGPPPTENIALRSELDTLQALLNAATTADGRCPTCAQALPDEKALEKARKRFRAISAEVEDFRKQAAAHKKALYWYNFHLDTKRELTERVANKKIALAGLPEEVEDADIDEEGLKQLVKQHEIASTRLAELQRSAVSLDRELAYCEANLKKDRQALVENQDQLAKIDCSAEKVTRAKERLAELKTAELQLATLQERLSAEKRRGRDLTTQLETAEEIVRKAHERGRFARQLDTLRQMFHRDSLPHDVHSSYWQETVARVNDNLKDFDSPFSITPGEGLELLFRKKNSVRDVGWLSGGEQAVLGIAMQLAIRQTFAKHIQLLVLDEPTDGLDEPNLGRLQTALERLAHVSKQRHQQVILITHEDSLESVFDRTIRLEPPR